MFQDYLSSLDRRFTTLQVLQANTLFQLMTVSVERCNNLLIFEHDPLLYFDAEDIVGYVSLAMRAEARQSTLLLCLPASDLFLETMTCYPHRLLCSGRWPDNSSKPSARSCRKVQVQFSQRIPEAF